MYQSNVRVPPPPPPYHPPPGILSGLSVTLGGWSFDFESKVINKRKGNYGREFMCYLKYLGGGGHEHTSI